MALLTPTTLVADAHKAALVVADYRFDPVKEYLQFYMLGVDGVFSDFGDTALRTRSLLRH